MTTTTTTANPLSSKSNNRLGVRGLSSTISMDNPTERLDPLTVPWRYLVMGNKGSGKTSLINCLTGNYQTPETRFLHLKRVNSNAKSNEEGEEILLPCVRPSFTGIEHSFPGSAYCGPLDNNSNQPDPEVYKNAEIKKKEKSKLSHLSIPLGDVLKENTFKCKTHGSKLVWFHEVPSFHTEGAKAEEMLATLLCANIPQGSYKPSLNNDKLEEKEMVTAFRTKLKELKNIKRIQADRLGESVSSYSTSSSNSEGELENVDPSSSLLQRRDSKETRKSGSGTVIEGEDDEEEEEFDAIQASKLKDRIDLSLLKFDPLDSTQDDLPLFCPGLAGIIYVFRTNVLFEDCLSVDRFLRASIETYSHICVPILKITKEVELEGEKMVEKILGDMLPNLYKKKLYEKVAETVQTLKTLLQIPCLKGLPVILVFNHNATVKSTMELPLPRVDNTIYTEDLTTTATTTTTTTTDPEKIPPVTTTTTTTDENVKQETPEPEPKWSELYFRLMQRAMNIKSRPDAILSLFKLTDLGSIISGGIDANSIDPMAKVYECNKFPFLNSVILTSPSESNGLTTAKNCRDIDYNSPDRPPFYATSPNSMLMGGNLYNLYSHFICSKCLHQTERAYFKSLMEIDCNMSGAVKFTEFKSSLRQCDFINAIFFPISGFTETKASNLEMDLALLEFNSSRRNKFFPIYHPHLIRDREKYIELHQFKRKHESEVDFADTIHLYDNVLKEDKVKSDAVYYSLCILWDWVNVWGRAYDRNVAAGFKENPLK